MQSGRTFRVFVSSTFEDLKAERDRLHEDVFPRLREFCRERGARFQAIDLRWGVSEEASLDQQTMNICLSEIARCLKTTPRPNFIVLLGQRYGWCPPPPQIPGDEFEQIVGRVTDRDDRDLLEMWYRRDDNAVPPEYRLQPRERGSEYETYAGWRPVESRLHEILAGAIQGMRLTEERRRPYVASATEQEIAAGALRVSRPAGKVFCFLRKIEGARDENGELRAGADRYIDADQAPLDTLEAELIKKLPDGVRRYEARWSEEEGRPTTEHLDRLAADVYEALARAIQSELDQPSEIAPTEEEVHIEPDRMLDGEGRAHCEFANRLLHRFVGRTDPLQAIHEYLEGEGRRPLAIVAEGGAGKSALVARALEQAVGERSRARIVYRFIGATPRSTDGRTLLYDLCRELSRRYGADEGKVPSDYRELGPLFGSRLALATAKRPLILFLDALDQLSEAHGARGLAWLPDDLPRHVWLVVSGRRQAETFESLERKRSEQLELGPMSRPDGELLLRLWLADAGRTLQAAQLEEVLGKFESKESDGRPLFLRLAFEEARRWSSYDAPETLEPGIEAIIRENLFRRLADEQHHGAVLVSRALGYLAASRFGLAEDELLDVLSRDADLYTSFLRGLYHVPPDLLARARDYRRRRETSRVEGDGKAEPDEARATEEWLALLRSDEAKATELDRFLKDILPRRDGPRLPVVLWSRLSFDLEPYLTERPSAAGSLRAFYHRELEDTAAGEYLRDEAGRERHGMLADYFRVRADPDGDGRWSGDYPRGLGELPYHLSRAARWEELRETLTEFDFLYAKVAALGPQPLIDDYDRAAEAGYEEEGLGLVQDALRLSAHVTGDDVNQLAGQLVGRLLYSEMPAVKRLAEEAGEWQGSVWLRPLSAMVTGAGGQLLRTLEGHTDAVWSVAVTPDGRFAVSGARGGTIKLWDLRRAEAPRTLEGHAACVDAVAVTPDGRRAVSGSSDGKLKVWDLEQGVALRTFGGHDGLVIAVAVTPDGRYAVSGATDGTLKVWDLEQAPGPGTGTLKSRLVKWWFSLVDRLDRGLYLLTRYTPLDVWPLWGERAVRDEALRTLKGHEKPVPAVAVTPDGRYVVSGSEDGTLKVWDLERGEALHTLEGAGKVRGVAVTRDGRCAVSAGDKTLKYWDLERGVELGTLEGHEDYVFAVAVTPDGRRAVSGSKDETLRVWDLERRVALGTLEGHRGAVSAVAVTPDGRYAVSGCAGHERGGGDWSLKVWDLERRAARRAAVHSGRVHSGRVNVVAVTSDRRYAVSGSRDTTVKVWDFERMVQLRTLEGHDKPIEALAVTPDGRHAVSSSRDRTLRVWDLELGEEVRAFTMEGHSGHVIALAVTPDGRHVVSGDTFGRLMVWDLEGTKEPRALWGSDSRWVLAVAITEDGRYAVSSSRDRTLKLWDLERGVVVRTLKGHKDAVLAVAVTPDGRYAVSGSRDATLRVWDLEPLPLIDRLKHRKAVESALYYIGTVWHGFKWRVLLLFGFERLPSALIRNRALRTLRGHTRDVNAVGVTPDGRFAVSASDDESLKVWDLERGINVATWVGETGEFTACTVASDGKTVVAGDESGYVHFLRLEGV